MDSMQLREHIIRPALERIGLWSADAEELLMGTCAQESKLGQFHRQMGNGPALGIFQMEPVTHDDCWNNYLKYHAGLALKIKGLVYGEDVIGDTPVHPPAEILVSNDRYAAAMARVKYLRAPAPIPSCQDLIGMDDYWKQHYNTPKGRGTVSEFCDHYVNYVVGV